MIKKYWIYILLCNNGNYYTGYTTDIVRRYHEHVAGTGKCKYTRSFKPINIAQCWVVYDDKSLAMKIEKYIKKLVKSEKEKLIQFPGDLLQLFLCEVVPENFQSKLGYNMKNDFAIFEEYEIRRLYDEKTETWVFSVIDIIQALTQQPNNQTARKYWNKLKERLKNEGSQAVTNCHQLKLVAEDGRLRLTDTANAETLLRLIQSVPSPKAEPIKLWLALVSRIIKNLRD